MAEQLSNDSKAERASEETFRPEQSKAACSTRLLEEINNHTFAGSGFIDASAGPSSKCLPCLNLVDGQNEKNRNTEGVKKNLDRPPYDEELYSIGKKSEPGDSSPDAACSPEKSEEELNRKAKDIANSLEHGRGNFGTKEEQAQLLKEMKEAEESGQLQLLIAKINEQLARTNSGLNINFKIENHQDKILPELNPYTSWKHVTLNLNAESGYTLDTMNFDGKPVHHEGKYRSRF